ncbi:MAG: nickel pincer cofactor biosynthesis protein LarB [Defluviitaleaceae bacterium]|nr:nickel pincer cofactor biosynthesis protein LarB [Defluviitaleaceae bacterium]
MGRERIVKILKQIEAGELTADAALTALRMEPFEDLGYAKLDHHRELRQGVAEVIYGETKTPEQIMGIVSAMRHDGPVLITRMAFEAAEHLKTKFEIKYDPLSRVCIIGDMPEPNGIGNVVVATGGTCDMAVAEEASLTAEVLGNKVIRLYDVGVAGLHRLLSNLDKIMEARVIVAIAGMEGALASVVGGLADCPVIGVPTSVGYGAAFNGLSALLTMLNSCASGVCVVNIDNGFGAGFLASMINHQ